MYNVLVIVEDGENNLSAYAADVPGACAATGKTREELEHNMYEALQWHIKGTLEDGLVMPKQPSIAVYMAVPVNQGDTVRMYRFLVLVKEEQGSWTAWCDELADWSADDEITVQGSSREQVEEGMYYELQKRATALLAKGEEVPQYPSSAVYMIVPVAGRELVAA